MSFSNAWIALSEGLSLKYREWFRSSSGLKYGLLVFLELAGENEKSCFAGSKKPIKCKYASGSSLDCPEWPVIVQAKC